MPFDKEAGDHRGCPSFVFPILEGRETEQGACIVSCVNGVRDTRRASHFTPVEEIMGERRQEAAKQIAAARLAQKKDDEP